MKLSFFSPLVVVSFLLLEFTPDAAAFFGFGRSGTASVSFGSGSSLTTTGLLTLSSTAPAGSTTTCTLSCTAGSSITLSIQYGSVPTRRTLAEEDLRRRRLVADEDQHRRLASCGDGVSVTSGSAQTNVGYRIATSSSFTSLSLTCTWASNNIVDPGPDVDVDFIACFSGSTVVDVLDKGRTPMRELGVGDKVLDSDGSYAQVYAFGHHQPAKVSPFVVLETNNQTTQAALEVTANHFVYKLGEAQPVAAGSIRVGDRLAPHGATVTKVYQTTKAGIYTPLTTSGTFLVSTNGPQALKVSSYASVAQHNTAVNNGQQVQLADGTSLGISHQEGIHLVLTPYRLWCRFINQCTIPSAGDKDANGMPRYVFRGIQVLEWANQQQNVLMQLVLFVLALIVFLGLYMLEKLLESMTETSSLWVVLLGMVWGHLKLVRKAANGTK